MRTILDCIPRLRALSKVQDEVRNQTWAWVWDVTQESVRNSVGFQVSELVATQVTDLVRSHISEYIWDLKY